VTAVNDKGAIVTSWPSGAPPFTLRKTVNPSQTCLLCHGKHPAENMGLSGTWPELRADLESPEQPNGCLTCHSDIRTNRHNVSYLNATGIEKAAKEGSDVCFGCHGGRQWYRIAYPYPRHPWPGAPDETPDWAKDRPVHSDPRFELPTK
jgi:nitrate/TMAO reductase-like tetraheme cytochrome c subunit